MVSKKFCTILLHASFWYVYIKWLKLFELYKVPTVICSIVVAGMLTWYALLHLIGNLKVAQMNIQCSLICELKLYEFKLGLNTAEIAKSICYVNGEDTVGHCTVTR